MLYLVGIAVGLLGLGVAVRLVRAWMRFRGDRAITCPENLRPAGVRVDALHAAATSFHNAPEFRLSACSRWPERAGCGQQCLAQVEASPQGCLVKNILAEWYENENCVSCGRPFGAIDWMGAKPAVLTRDGESLEWSQVSADQLSEVLVSSSPVCFACHMANQLMRKHPELVTDRARPALQIQTSRSVASEAVAIQATDT